MPSVKGKGGKTKKFPYTKKGKADAAKYAKAQKKSPVAKRVAKKGKGGRYA
jgi:hypothetical protein|tara:strand:+ start:1531 stop:1683 length:153 start_codon:yes stop_codon:yes gene_type:complete